MDLVISAFETWSLVNQSQEKIVKIMYVSIHLDILQDEYYMRNL